MAMRLICVVSTLCFVVGCAASVGTIVTGKARPAVEVSVVKLYSSPPRAFEDVAIVTAEAQSGWTDQGQINNAVAGLKKKAAQLGANGILIEATGKQGGGSVAIPNGTGGFMIATADSQVVKGRAIFVTQE
jgi:hypothetical protein